MYCLLICIAVYVDVVNTKDVIVFGDKFVTQVVQVSIFEPDIYEVIVIASVGCQVGGDSSEFIENEKDNTVSVMSKFDAVTIDDESPMHWNVDLKF